jgi:acetyl-CoA carboxylase biotin carboxyl carrier protein
VSDEPTGRVSSEADTETGAALDAVTEEILPALIARLRSSRLGELEVASDGWRVRLRRETSAAARRRGGASSGSGADASSASPPGGAARSPGVGYFKPVSDLVIGRSVQAGDALGSVDVLGIVLDVTAPTDGIISRVLAEPGQAVEYGQVLAEVDQLEPDVDLDLGAAEQVLD